jgi:hypothetical protein
MSEVSELKWGVYVGGDLMAAFRDIGRALSIMAEYYPIGSAVKPIEKPLPDTSVSTPMIAGANILTSVAIPAGCVVAVDGNKVMLIDLGDARGHVVFRVMDPGRVDIDLSEVRK